MSNFRVAPLKKITLQHPELMRSLNSGRVPNDHKNILQVSNFVFWTDSEIVLNWMKGSKVKWKPFVPNRISEIHALTDPIL